MRCEFGGGPRWRRGPGGVVLLAVALGQLGGVGSAGAQNLNVLWPPDSVVQRLCCEPFDVGPMRGARYEGDRTKYVPLTFADDSILPVKWAKAPDGGEGEFNNEPRYELAAYELQRLFLAPPEYVVPPTTLRAVPLRRYREFEAEAEPTFEGTTSVVVLLAYWLFQVQPLEDVDWDRVENDRPYAAAIADLNTLTFLIDHKDANVGNFLISTAGDRAYAVDNGVAFDSRESNRGTWWGRWRVERLPRSTAERLEALEEEDLVAALAVMVQFSVGRDGQLVRTEPGPNLDSGDGVRFDEDRGIIQFGLDSGEITDVWLRLRDLQRKIASGQIELFETESAPGSRRP